jgi:acyl carrier protein
MSQLQMEDFVRRVERLMNRELGPDRAPIDPSASLYDDLGLDSIEALQLLIAIESIAGIDVPPLEVPALYTVQDAFEYYSLLVRQRS